MRFIVSWIAGLLSAVTIMSMLIGGTEIWFGVIAIVMLNVAAIAICKQHHQKKKDQFWNGLKDGNLKL